MTTVSTHGKVKKYPNGANGIICTYKDPDYLWKGNKLRVGGGRLSVCNVVTRIFDVTVDQDTADKLSEGYVFLLEYDDRHHPGLKENERLVTNFAGYTIQLSSPLAIAPGAPVGVIASTSPSSQPPSSPSGAPQQ